MTQPLTGIDPAIVDYYERAPEESRLEQGALQLEQVWTRELIERDLRDGQHRNPTERLDYFTTAYFHHHAFGGSQTAHSPSPYMPPAGVGIVSRRM